MAGPALDDNEDKPLDPAVERVRRKLVRFVAINVGLLMIALIAVVAALVYKRQSDEPRADAEIAAPAEGETLTGAIPLPSGARVLSHGISGGRLTLHIETAAGQSILLYDIAGARIVGRFALVAE
jgi:hypothetical protein